MSIQEKYFISDNPFPTTPTLDPSSDDDRINGKIYNPHIREAEIRSFEGKIHQHLPLIYIENSIFERGVGKSALLVQQWRQMQNQPEVSSIYLRSKEGLKPNDFVARIIDRWHYEGYLWSVILNSLEAYTKANPKGEISQSGYKHFKDKLPKQPTRPISLSNFNVFNSKLLVNDLATMVYQKVGDHLPLELAKLFFEKYLSEPSNFLSSYPSLMRKQKWDDITVLAGLYRLLDFGSYHYHYLFLDQFEDAVHGLTGKALITFNSEMRRLIEASIGKATIIITLHPGAAQALATHEGGDLRSIAPHDSRYVVDVLPLTEDGVKQLAQTYIDHYRISELNTPDPLFPFTAEALVEIYKASRGNIRSCLQALNYAIVCGESANYHLIDKSFLIAHHSEITGKVHPEEVTL